MSEPRFTLQQVVETVEEAQRVWRKAMRFTLAFRTFTAALLGFLLTGLLLISGIPASYVAFVGAGIITSIFFTLDYTSDTILDYVRSKRKEKANDSDSSGSDETD